MNASLSHGSSITEAIDAAGKAMSIEQNYGFNSSSSGCTAPPDLLLANTSVQAAAQLGESQMGVSCISYDAAGTISVSVLDSGIFPVGGLSAIYKTAWGNNFRQRYSRVMFGFSAYRELQLTTVLVCGRP